LTVGFIGFVVAGWGPHLNAAARVCDGPEVPGGFVYRGEFSFEFDGVRWSNLWHDPGRSSQCIVDALSVLTPLSSPPVAAAVTIEAIGPNVLVWQPDQPVLIAGIGSPVRSVAFPFGTYAVDGPIVEVTTADEAHYWYLLAPPHAQRLVDVLFQPVR
jgi:hypothetical protein